MASLIDKLSSFGEHHQLLVALAAAFGIVAVTWGTERLLEEYVLPKKKPYSYFVAIGGGLALLWVTKHFILHVL